MPSDYLPHSPAESHHMDAPWGRSVVDSQRRSRIRVGSGLTVRTTRNGTVIAAKPARVFRAASDGDHPFKVIDASDSNGPKVRVMPGCFNGWESTVGGAENSSPNVWYPVGGRTEQSPPIPTLPVSPATPWVVLYFESAIASGNVYSPGFTLHDVRAMAAGSGFLEGYEWGTKRAHKLAYLQFDAAGKIMSIRQQVFRNLAGDCTQWQNNSHAYVRFWS